MKVYRHTDTVICCSQFMKKKIDENMQLNGRTVSMHNFIDPPEHKNVEKKDYVLYFGRFAQEKGTRTLLNVCKQMPDIPFVFAGKGPMEDQVRGVNIENVGFQSGDALKKLIQEARFSVYPSEWYENCPFSVMESLIYGTPVLGADIGGIPELIQPGKTGFLFESGNESDLKEKIARMWAERESICLNADKDVKFDDAETYCKQMMKIYSA